MILGHERHVVTASLNLRQCRNASVDCVMKFTYLCGNKIELRYTDQRKQILVGITILEFGKRWFQKIYSDYDLQPCLFGGELP